LGLWESGAILMYLAEKSGQLLPEEPQARWETVQWLMWQMGGIGPMFGQVGFFVKFGGKDYEDTRPRQRYVDEAERLLNVLDGQLSGQDWITGSYSIADIAVAPWLRSLRDFYQAGDLVDWDEFDHVDDYLNRFLAREAVARALP